MPARVVKQVADMEIDEISLVDRPANQHARLAIAKRQSSEDEMSSYFDAQGNEVTETDLEPGDLVFDAQGEVWQYAPEGYEGAETDEDAQDATDDQRELAGAGAGVSKAFAATPAYQGPGLVEAVSKALEGISKADERELILKQALLAAAQEAEQAGEIAKSERTVRLTREYIAKAAQYNVPATPEELGPVLMRMAVDPSSGNAWPEGSQQFRDCAVIHKALSAAGEILTTELGYSGGADNSDPFAKVEAVLSEQIAKSGAKVSKAQAIESYFDNDPAEYDAYRELQSQR